MRIVLVVLTCTSMNSCSRHTVSDDELIAAFKHDSTLFERLAQNVYANPFNCYKEAPDICLPTGIDLLKAQIEKTLTFPVLGMHVKRRLNNSLWIPVLSNGASLSINSKTRGYVYCQCPLTPVTDDTAHEGRSGVWYRTIGHGWMLYVSP